MSFIPKQILETGAYGETMTAELNPVASASAQYNHIDLGLCETFSATGGAVTATGGEFVCTTGTSVGGYGVIRTREAVIYRPGQGVIGRWSARFTTGVANCLQFGGLFTATDGFYIGYNGTDFACMHEYGGALEARTLTLSASASGTESLTIVVNDDSHTFNVTSGSSALNAGEIVAELNANIAGWSFTQNDGTVVGYSLSTGAKSGTYSFTNNTGGGTAAGSWAQVTAGAVTTRDAIAQANWNGDALSATLDPTKGNVYQVQYQYLGFGAIRYFIEDGNTGKFVNVHTIKYENTATSPSVTNPSMKVGITSASLGSTTDLTVATGSFALFTEGLIHPSVPVRGFDNTKSIATTKTNLLTIRNRRIYQGIANQGHIDPIFLTLANDGSKSAVFEFYANTTLGGTPNYTFIDEDNSITEYDTAGTTVTGGILVAAIVVARLSSTEVDLSKYSFKILPTDTFTITGNVTSGSASDLSVGLTWEEDL